MRGHGKLFATATAILLLLANGSTAHQREHEGGEVMVISDVEPGGAAADAEGFTAEECLAWVEGTYSMTQMAEKFGLDLVAEIEENRSCMDHDTQRMAQPIPQTWCDNVFKVHCSGLDLLAEIGDAQVARCTAELSDSLGVDLSRNAAWNTCGEQKVFDRYSMRGEASDEGICREILVEECGAKIDG